MSEHSQATDKPVQRKGFFRRFCIDLWWLHLIIIIIVALVVTLPVIFVAYPRIAQHDVNDSELTITEMSITKPRPAGFSLNLTTELGLHSTFHPSLKAWNGSVYVAGSDKPYLNLQIPEFQAKDGALTNIQKEVNLNQTELDIFTNYVRVLLVNETVTSYLIGRGPLRLGALQTVHVNYNKTLEMDGFGGLKGITITNSRLVTNQPDNATLAGKVTIPNTSSGKVELGDLTFGLSLPAGVAVNSTGPTPIGSAKVRNVVLPPHSNSTFDLRSIADQSTVLSAFTANATYAKTGLPVTILTTKVEYDGQEIPWLTAALGSAPIQQFLNITEIIANTGGGGGAE